MKKLMMAMAVVVAAATVFGAPARGKKAAAGSDEETEAVSGKSIKIDQYPKLGQASCLQAPFVQGGSAFGPAWKGKLRKWIVLESQYSTLEKCVEQLTFTWHVILETRTATSKDREGQKKLAPYSYFTQSVTYYNIPRGTHAASVCLHPSYLEQYGEPKAVGLVVTDANGQELVGNSFSELKPIKSGTKFWEDEKVMDAKQANDEPYIARRQGLQDRAKTIWALVNPNDYELTLQ